MKTSPLFWPNLFYKYLGTALMGLCLSFPTFSQSTPLATPDSVKYPGIIETLEKIIELDASKVNKKNELLIKARKTTVDTTHFSSINLDPDYLNSIILHSDPGYIKLASTSKCRFYDVIINDLLKNAGGKLNNVFITYTNKNNEIDSALIEKKDFINKVVPQECPETPALIGQFQVKNIDEVIQKTNFDVPSGRDHCHNVYVSWLNDAKTPYYCKLHEFMDEAKSNRGDQKDLPQRQAVTKILERKLNLTQRDYIATLCSNLSSEESFCEEFLNVSFWTKVSSGLKDRIYAEDVCKSLFTTPALSELQLKSCLSRLKKENDLCLFPNAKDQGLLPFPQCDAIATALNYSSMRSNYQDCPGLSDQQGITNLSRLILNITKGKIPEHTGPCSSVSSGAVFEFNQQFNNEENWKLEACFDDKTVEKEFCYKTFFGSYGQNPASYNVIVADILRKTRGADSSLKCQMVDSEDYSPLHLQYKSGCFIVYDRANCFISQCKHKIIYNDRPVDFIRLKNHATLDYFPSSVVNERYSQHYLLTRDFKQTGKLLNNLSAISEFFKKSRLGVIHGVGCAEEILPSFFKSRSLNQCSPLPFIIDGMIREDDKTIFVTRTGVDSLQAPRLVSWSLIYSAVKAYQQSHPLKLWTMYGLD